MITRPSRSSRWGTPGIVQASTMLLVCTMLVATTSAGAGALRGTASAVAPDQDDPYRRLGDESRLVTLRELETKPFEFETLAALPGWQGEPISKESVDDRVVLLLAWDAGDAKSVRLIPTLARLQRSMSDDLACVAVHTRDGWDAASKQIEAGRIAIPAAHDAEGTLLETLKADDHPNLYLIDRAGNMRMADLDPRDLGKAVRALSRETPEQAASDLPRRIERFAETRGLVPDSGTPQDDQRDMPGGTPADPSGNPSDDAAAVPPALRGLMRPDHKAYAAADWPRINRDEFRAMDVQGRTLPVPLGQETWLSEKPKTPLNDHVLVVDFWATWCGQCLRASPTLDRLQERNQGELMVLAVSGQAYRQFPEDTNAIRNHMRRDRVSYYHLHDAEQRVYKSLRISAIPHTIVMSTDGVVRWQGNPLSPDFQRAVERVIEADPLIAMRRAQAKPSDQNDPQDGSRARPSRPRP
jgi:thiol-disulfide isomerase/thioredoxin